jgi:hypothetical protein
MLFYSKLNVSQIGEALGYFDNSYFVRFFKKNVGSTPLAFLARYKACVKSYELENTHIPHRRGSRRRNSRNRGTHRRSSQQRGYNSRRTRNNRGNRNRSIISQSIIRGGTKIHDSDFSHLSKLEEQKLEEASNKEDMFFKKLKKI